MLTGRPPFRAETPLETVLQVLHEEPVPPTRLRPKVPRDLETICLKCLEKAPSRRYATALELAEDLDRFLNFEPVRARPVAAPERLWRWCRRKTSLAIADGPGRGRDRDRRSACRSAWPSTSTRPRPNSERRSTRSSRDGGRSTSRRAHLAYEHGQTLCEQGDVAQGLALAGPRPEERRLARDENLERAFRLNLAAWRPRLHPLRVRCEHPRRDPRRGVQPRRPHRRDRRRRQHGPAPRRRHGRAQEMSFPHPAKVDALAFSPDGRTLLTGCDDGIARLCGISTEG